MNDTSSLDALKDIRSLMERSSRFLSLSGLSGILIGLYALAAAAASAIYAMQDQYGITSYYLLAFKPNGDTNNAFINFHLFLAAALILASMVTSLAMARRAAQRKGLPAWDRSARRLALNLLIPLFAGGLFILALLQRLELSLIAPAMLVFYGLALVNASKYSFDELRYMGLLQIMLGLLSAFIPAWGLVCWAMGFGVLHIVYGLMMHYKYRQ